MKEVYDKLKLYTVSPKATAKKQNKAKDIKPKS